MSDGRIKAVVGLAFNEDMDWVLLIRKKRPMSQAGKLNGVGGKVEPGERFLDAMVREFREETGIKTEEDEWTCFATLDAPRWDITFFKAIIPMEVLERVVTAKPPTDERLELWDMQGVREENTLRNLKWMVPFCRDTSPYELPIRLKELEVQNLAEG